MRISIRNRIRRFSCIVSVTCLCTSTSAQPAPVRDHDLTPEDYFSVAVITGCAISPDGQSVAYTEARWEPPSEQRNTDLWIVDSAGGTPRRMTFDPGDVSSPRWAPDSKTVYYAGTQKRGGEEDAPYNGKRQVWGLRAGGDAFAVTRVKDGIGQFALSKDGRVLYYTTSDETYEEEWKDLRKSHKELKYGHGVDRFSQLWSLDLETWRATKVVDEKRVIQTFAVSDDGKRIAMITTPREELLSNEGWSRVDLYDANTKSVAIVTEDGWRKSHPSPYGWLNEVAWSSDGRSLAYTISYDGYPPQIFVTSWRDEKLSRRELPRPAEVTVQGGSLKWRGGSRDLCFLGERRARQYVYCIPDVTEDTQGLAKVVVDGDVCVSGFDFAAGGETAAVVISTLEHVDDVFLVTDSKSPRRLTRVNPQIDTWKLPRISLVQWKGADGAEVEGILELPPSAKPGDKFPMVVEIHGGPTASTPYRLLLNIYGRAFLPAKGYAILSPNYRGSTGYGDKFMTDLIGRENDIEVQDILRGVDAMVERGVADADRLAVMGWSNGGFLTNCLITHTPRFKAASSGAGVLDQVIQWGTEDTPGHVINYMKALPWSNADAYRKASPIFALDKVKTPTLIHVGENDERVPAAHARALYRALRHYLNIPTELVVYPREGHGLSTYSNRKAKMEWDIAWFDRYVRGETAAPQIPKEKGATN